MGKYDELIGKLIELGFKPTHKTIGDCRPETKRAIEFLLNLKVEQKKDTTLYQPAIDIKVTPVQQKIINTIRREEKIRFKDLAIKLEIEQNYLWNELNILFKLGIINKETKSRREVYYTVP